MSIDASEPREIELAPSPPGQAPDPTGGLRRRVVGGGLGPTLVRASMGGAGLRIGAMGLSLLVGVLLARLLGAAGYGTYTVVIAVVTIMTVPTEFGLPSLVMREVAVARVHQDWALMRGILQWSNIVVGVVAALMLGGAALVLTVQPGIGTDGFADALLWGLLLIPLVTLGNLRGAALRGLGRLVIGQVPELLIRPALFVLTLAMATLLGASLDAADAIALNVVAAGVAFVAGAVVLFRAIPPECRRATAVIRSRRWSRSAIPLGLSNGARYLQVNVLVLLLGALVVNADVGLYGVAAQVAALVALPLTVLDVVNAPVISRLNAEEDHGRLQRLASHAAVGMFLGGLAIFVVFAVFGRSLLTTFFGPEFEGAYGALLILCAGQLFSAFFGFNATLLNMTGHEDSVARALLLSLCVTVVLGLGLIMVLGIEGAAVASVAGLVLWNVITWRIARGRMRIDTSFAGAFLRSVPLR